MKKIVPDARQRATHVPTEQDTEHKASGGSKDQVVVVHSCENMKCCLE